MNRLLAALVFFALVACATPRSFLQTDSKATSAWLDTIVDVDLQNMPLMDLSRRGPFQEMKFVFDGVDGGAVISFEAEHITRREALQQLAEKYGLAMTLTGPPTAIRITNREVWHENKPLN